MLERRSGPKPTPALALSLAAALLGAELMLLAASLVGAIPSYVEVCEEAKYPYHYECATYHVALVPIIKLGSFVDKHEGTILAAATILLAVFTLRLWRATANLVNTHEKNARKELRAYLGISVAEKSKPSPRKRFEVMIRVWNYGQTPARNVRFKGWCDVRATAPRNGYARAQSDGDAPDGPKSCNPGEGINSGLRYAVRSDAVPKRVIRPALMKTGAEHLYVYGSLTYEDVFGRTWHTDFCAAYRPDLAVDDYPWIAARQHNDAT